jgi:hypothetical protein
MLWTAIGTAGIWIAVVVISFFALDMVSGSEHQHLPIAAFSTWLWGAIGTAFFIWAMGKLRGSGRWSSTWIGVSVATLVVWTVATIIAITAPEFVTGTDPHPLRRPLRADRCSPSHGPRVRHRQRVPTRRPHGG